MYQRILHDPLKFPEERNGNGHNGQGEGVTPEAKSIMQGLLQREPTKRLGAGGSEEIKRHPFFARWIDWTK
jgi:serum/glucocorticoid-regulated kinase 2